MVPPQGGHIFGLGLSSPWITVHGERKPRAASGVFGFVPGAKRMALSSLNDSFLASYTPRTLAENSRLQIFVHEYWASVQTYPVTSSIRVVVYFELHRHCSGYTDSAHFDARLWCNTYRCDYCGFHRPRLHLLVSLSYAMPHPRGPLCITLMRRRL